MNCQSIFISFGFWCRRFFLFGYDVSMIVEKRRNDIDFRFLFAFKKYKTIAKVLFCWGFSIHSFTHSFMIVCGSILWLKCIAHFVYYIFVFSFLDRRSWLDIERIYETRLHERLSLCRCAGCRYVRYILKVSLSKGYDLILFGTNNIELNGILFNFFL